MEEYEEIAKLMVDSENTTEPQRFRIDKKLRLIDKLCKEARGRLTSRQIIAVVIAEEIS